MLHWSSILPEIWCYFVPNPACDLGVILFLSRDCDQGVTLAINLACDPGVTLVVSPSCDSGVTLVVNAACDLGLTPACVLCVTLIVDPACCEFSRPLPKAFEMFPIIGMRVALPGAVQSSRTLV